ncbi:transposase [Acuticoccus sp. M5D2P5]|uniref:transposase n=2 Tax=Acuticoccus kalidii TaxID=2910977 RepID=UPI001F273B0D|nr:transposase [Acuticoccus kalidii]MCF3935863.1 transposase [Acuticoccus kalidii]
MMGRQIEHASLFYEFNLEDRVPDGHLLRRVDAVLDLSFVRRHMAAHYSATGRPSIDPELMVRMLLIGYLFGIRSERRLCEEVDLNLAYRWFCRLDLAGKVPDHSTFTKNRHGRFRESGLMRTVFETTVEQCLSAGIASAAHVAVDGSHMRASAAQDRCVASVTDLPSADQASRAVREYLSDLDQASPDLEGVRRSAAKRVSLTDPAAALSRKHGKARFAYGMNALVDTQSGVVLGVQAAPERFADEPEAARRMIERLRVRHDAVPQVLTADKAYGSGPFLAWIEGRGIEAHVPVIDRTHQTAGRMTHADFGYDKEGDLYLCPQGKPLRRVGDASGEARRSGTTGYRSRASDCKGCPIKTRCTTSSTRAISRSLHQDVRVTVQARQATEAFERSLRLRKRVERLFACVKHNDGLHRLRLRGLRGADEQFVLAATAQNLKRMTKFFPADGPGTRTAAA